MPTETLGTIYTLHTAVLQGNALRVMFSRWNSKPSTFLYFQEEFGDFVCLRGPRPGGYYHLIYEDLKTFEEELVGIFIPTDLPTNIVLEKLKEEFACEVELHTQESILKGRRMMAIQLSHELDVANMGGHPILVCACYDYDEDEDDGDKDKLYEEFDVVIETSEERNELFQCECEPDEIGFISLN